MTACRTLFIAFVLAMFGLNAAAMIAEGGERVCEVRL